MILARSIVLTASLACQLTGATHRFEPTEFYNTFSHAHKPALRIRPGDRVITKTIDARGFDEHGRKVGPQFNPQTGPFYVEGAQPGDALVVYLDRVEPNRRTGWTNSLVVEHALDRSFLSGAGERKPMELTWTIDKARGIARMEHESVRPAIEVPLRPMLGCIAVAPPDKKAIPTSTPDSFGGNLDYNGMVPGVKLLLPVSEPGALLFVGDGHATQGDGEILGNAVETSMNVEFRVDLVKGANLRWPRIETAEHLIVLGSAPPPLTGAVQNATAELQRWLMSDYGFNERGAALLLGHAIEYDIANIVDPHYTVAAKIARRRLGKLPK